MQKISLFFFRLGLFILASSGWYNLTYAWGATGHRVVGGIAEQHLTHQAKAYVRYYLKGAKLQDVSNWADEIRSDESPWAKSIIPWHFYTVTADHPIKPSINARTAWPKNLLDALVYCQYQLAQGGSFEKQATLLKLLVHLVGDAHQPLHVSTAELRGGNLCKVYWYRRSGFVTQLHAVWDSRFIDAQKLSYSETVDYLMPLYQKERKGWLSQSFADWIQESYDHHATIMPKMSGPDPYKYCKSGVKLLATDIPVLSFQYQYQNKALLDQRLLQAGLRLADLINQLAADSSKIKAMSK